MHRPQPGPMNSFWAHLTPGNSFIGRFRYIFLHDVGAQPDPSCAAIIPLQTFMVMFAIITPALISGAFAERNKFSSMALFMVLWSIIVYAPMAHMVWGKGGLLGASLAADSPRSTSGKYGGPHHLRSFGTRVRTISRQHRYSARNAGLDTDSNPARDFYAFLIITSLSLAFYLGLLVFLYRDGRKRRPSGGSVYKVQAGSVAELGPLPAMVYVVPSRRQQNAPTVLVRFAVNPSRG